MEKVKIECLTPECKEKLQRSVKGLDLPGPQRVLFKQMFRARWEDDNTVNISPKGGFFTGALEKSGASIFQVIEEGLVKEGFVRAVDYNISVERVE